MGNYAQAQISGRLTKAPEARGSTGEVAALAIAVNRSYKRTGDDDWTRETHYLDATVFGPLAKVVIRKLDQGSLVSITGRLEDHRWTPKTGGDERRQVRIVVDELDSPDLYTKSANTDQQQLDLDPDEEARKIDEALGVQTVHDPAGAAA